MIIDLINQNQFQQYMSKQIQGQTTKKKADRQFGCPCGKWYLSYPALFTHVKQKHNGIPPGNPIKPERFKARGRPRLMTNDSGEDIQIMGYDCMQQLQKALQNKTIKYDDKYQRGNGNQTCRDMASQFIKISKDLQHVKIISCFLNYLKYFTNKKYQSYYWQTCRPNNLIDISNQIVRDLQFNRRAFPLERQTLIDLLYILARWMYQHKWTNDKLLKKSQAENINQTSQN